MSVCVIGSLNLDVICKVERLPLPGETVAGLGVERLPGGKGANQAVAAARAGAPTTLIGAVGMDEAGETMIEAVREAGVACEHIASLADHATGQAFVWVSAAGENSIVVALGANTALTLSADARRALVGHTVFLAQLECPVETVGAAFCSAPTRAGLTILNAAPAVDEGRRLLGLADIVVVNETELARYADLGTVPEALDDIVGAARRILSRPGQRIIVTLGGMGAVAVDADGVLRVAGRKAKVMDTTGAGDCFCGVLAARLSQGADLEAAMTWANAAAALSTQRIGAIPSMPTRARIEATLAG